jgi:hypothetical protein
MGALLRYIFTMLILALSLSVGALSQAITVTPKSLDPSLRDKLISYETIFVNGPFTQGLTPEIAERMYPLGPMSRTLLALTALRMAADGIVDLDEPIVNTLPDLLAENPFQVAITPRHLLTETAGFAVPPKLVSYTIPAKNLMVQIRTAGQMAHSDATGWELLAKFLEKKNDRDLMSLIGDHVFSAALPSESLKLSLTVPGPHRNFGWLDAIEMSPPFIAEIVRLTIYNRDNNGERFLPADLYEQLVFRHNWRMHPMGPRRTLGGVMHTEGGRTWISPPSTSASGPTFMAFPRNGIAFIHFGEPDAAYQNAVLAVAQDRFLPPKRDTRLSESNTIYDTGVRLNGRYVRADTPSASLRERLGFLAKDTLTLKDTREGSLTVTASSGETEAFQKAAPYFFTNTEGSEAIFSPYAQGGYLYLNGVTYRYVGFLGDKALVINSVPYLLLTLFSCLLYARSQISARWRKMAWFGGIGTLLVIAGSAAEYLYWPDTIYSWNIPWLVNLWRLMLNVGLMLVLSLPLFSISFLKKNEIPSGVQFYLIPLHLAAVSIAAVCLFLVLVSWGLAGEFGAY